MHARTRIPTRTHHTRTHVQASTHAHARTHAQACTHAHAGTTRHTHTHAQPTHAHARTQQFLETQMPAGEAGVAAIRSAVYTTLYGVAFGLYAAMGVLGASLFGDETQG